VIRKGNKGFTLAELVMVVALVAVLSSMVLPVAKFTVKRRKEVELRLALRQVVEGVDIVGQETERRFLRRIPIDPMTRDDWELRSYQDDMNATSWGGENVYDIRTSSEGIAIDGTKYAEW